MYSLPITIYSDYWRRTKLWSAYFGSLAVLAAGTRYSSLNSLDITRTMQPPLQVVHSLSSDSLSMGILSADDDGQEAPSDELKMKITSKTQLINTEIPFDTQYIESDKLLPGTSQIQAKGEKGIRREVVKTMEMGGQPVDQQVESFELKSPKNEIIVRNTKPIPKKKVIVQNTRLARAKEEVDLAKLNISKTFNVEATAYTYTGNNTATGVEPREGLIAVDPKVIAMGSKLYVEGYGYAIAADTGGHISGNRIDVFFSTLRQCLDWGRKSVRIHVLESI